MIDENILSALERIYTASRSALQQTGHAHGLSALQAQIITFIYRRSTATFTQLAQHLSVSKPTISDAVATLLDKRLLKKTINKLDARGYNLTLTQKGRTESIVLGSYAAPFLDSVRMLSPPQKTALWEALLHLLRTMELQGLIPHQRMCVTCTHFAREFKGSDYYCRLMNLPLPIADLRLDCAEHERAAS